MNQRVETPESTMPPPQLPGLPSEMNSMGPPPIPSSDFSLKSKGRHFDKFSTFYLRLTKVFYLQIIQTLEVETEREEVGGTSLIKEE